MATHSSILTRRIGQTEEPGGLRSIGSQSQTQLKRLHTHAHDRLRRAYKAENIYSMTLQRQFC